jgi:serine/threonine protein phosphatase PrpC
LCTDGLTNMLSDAELADFFDRLHEGPLFDLAAALIDAANARGGHDNISVVLASLKNIRTPRDA